MLHQASAVAIGGRALIIEGPPGSGKSSLALALIDRGAVLIGDDGLMLTPTEGRLHAAPGPNIAGLLEVRNVALLPFRHTTGVPVALVLRLDPDAPRFVDMPDATELGGIPLPLIRLWPESPVLALRAELALSRHGLP